MPGSWINLTALSTAANDTITVVRSPSPILRPIKSTEQSVRVGCHATSYSRRRAGRFVRTGTSARRGVILPGRRFPARRLAHTTYRHKYFSPAAGARGLSKLHNLRASRNEAHTRAAGVPVSGTSVLLERARNERPDASRAVDTREVLRSRVRRLVYESRAQARRELHDARTCPLVARSDARHSAVRSAASRVAARHYLSRPPQAHKAATLCRAGHLQPESRYSRPDIILLYLWSERGG